MTDEHLSIRKALTEITPVPSHNAAKAPDLVQIYTPKGHEAALDPERPLVIGERGTGKSFWSATLLNDKTRSFIARSYPRLELDHCDVFLGFAGMDTDINGAPSTEMLDDLIEKDKHPAEKVWRAVLLNCVRRTLDLDLPARLRGVDGLAAWVEADAERAQFHLRKADNALRKQDRRIVILFDALDRLGTDWRQIRERTKALLRVTLAMRVYRAVKPKLFMREAQAEDRSIATFPDASKLLGAKVDLEWEQRDLYGLLFTLLANDSRAGGDFAAIVRQEAAGITLRNVRNEGLSDPLKQSEQKQEAIFAAMAGKYMGNNARKGKTYTWLYNHLSDGFGRVSPRTFLEALRHAANCRMASDVRFAITPKAMQAGAEAASKLRLGYLKEDYKWIEDAVEPLAELNVPCHKEDLFQCWQDAGVVQSIRASAGAKEYLEPIEFHEASNNYPIALLRALRRIGVAQRRANGRVNIPDIYRVAAKLLRRGGNPGITNERKSKQ
ncbi:MAG: hypothetical protein GY862_28950 [Gammaproteobacteria bacterium]|nr:hypothetical protein [Gammaproteobacteria bacterium]